jgi:hypothetical protein
MIALSKTSAFKFSLVKFGLQRHSTWNGCSIYENEVCVQEHHATNCQSSNRSLTTHKFGEKRVDGSTDEDRGQHQLQH